MRSKATDVPDFEAFANATGKRGALGLIMATGFQENVRAARYVEEPRV